MKQAVAALGAYRTQQELGAWLKNYMKAFPAMGSRDRRELRALVYGAIRMARLFPEATSEQKIWMGSVLAGGHGSEFVRYGQARAEWAVPPLPAEGADGATHCRFWAESGLAYRAGDWFPAHRHISPQVEERALLNGFLLPPRTWIRVRRGREAAVDKELGSKGWTWGISETSPQARWVEAGRALDGLASHQNASFEVQDLASQRTLRYMNPVAGEVWWDAFAGSGGKSLLLHDREPGVRLFVTDARPQVLQLLHERFTRAGIRSYSRYCADLGQRDPLENAGSFPQQFDAILADVPCTGSGTWSATPDWLDRFDAGRLPEFADRQFQLVGNLLPFVRAGGRLVYLTCSLYADENERVVERICSAYGWQCREMGYEQSSSEGGDVMFGAVLARN